MNSKGQAFSVFKFMILMTGLESTPNRGLWWESNKANVDALKPEEVETLEKKSIELDEKEGL